MSICRKCGKKYSKWATPVSAKGVCAECFQRELRNEPDVAPPKAALSAATGETGVPQANRHGCLTTWLVLVIVANAATAISTPLLYDAIRRTAPNASPTSVAVITIAAIANIIFALALFRWKKWGFFGFVASSLVAFGTNIYVGLGVVSSLVGLAGICVLYWVLHMGDASTRAWTRLE
jgi:hypothetical protein